MAGRGYDPQFMVPHAADVVRETAPVGPIVTAAIQARFTEALPHLTKTQRALIETLLTGKTRAAITHERGISRQSVHKTYWHAMEKIEAVFGRNDLFVLLRDSFHSARGRERLERVAEMMAARAG